MVRKRSFIFLYFTLLLVFSTFLFHCCPLHQSNNSIPSQVRPHVTEFVAQARARGILVSTQELTITFKNGLLDNAGEPIFGKYTHWYFPISRDVIQLDTTGIWWNGASPTDNITYSREKVIFHELSHFWLKRHEHKWATFPGGLPQSIMGTASLVSYDRHPFTRQYYLDELFEPKTPAPAWARKENCPPDINPKPVSYPAFLELKEVVVEKIREYPNPLFSQSLINIQLKRKVAKSVLKQIALSLREERKCYQQLHIEYRITPQDPNTPPWATTHFTPALEITIHEPGETD